MSKRAWKIMYQPVFSVQKDTRTNHLSQFKSTYWTIKVIKSSQHGSIKNKSQQNDPISFCDTIMGLTDKEEALETILLDFSNTLNAVHQDTLISKVGNVVLIKTTEDGHKTSVINSLLPNRNPV